MRDRYHTYDLAQSRNIPKMACVHVSACGRQRRRRRRVTGGAVAAGATGYHPLSDPEPPGAAPEPHVAPNGTDLAARHPQRSHARHTRRGHGRQTSHRHGADARATRTPPLRERPRPRRRRRRAAGGQPAPPTASNGRHGRPHGWPAGARQRPRVGFQTCGSKRSKAGLVVRGADARMASRSGGGSGSGAQRGTFGRLGTRGGTSRRKASRTSASGRRGRPRRQRWRRWRRRSRPGRWRSRWCRRWPSRRS